MYAIFGDSYITRLEHFTNGNIRFQHSCSFFGVSGMSTRNKFQLKFDHLLAHKPRYVFFNLGGNSIDLNCHPDTIFREIVAIIDDLKQNGVERVFVASIIQRGSFPAWTGMTKGNFNKIRRALNKKLLKHFGNDFVNVENKIRYPRHYDKDMVHPGNQEGGMEILRAVIHRSFSRTL